MPDSLPIPVALTIAGSDSGGGAGIQADLRTFAYHCVHGCSAITCVTAQNTLGVRRVDALSVAAVEAQIEAVLEDINIFSVKTGMLLNEEIIKTVAKIATQNRLPNLVVDPVMVSRGGDRLIDEAAVKSLRDCLIPQSVMVTPNRYEAQILSGLEINTIDDMKRAAQAIYQMGSVPVLVKGGGMPELERGVDVWFDGEKMEILQLTRIATSNNHGTGCTLSAAIAANLALGKDKLSAVKAAKEYVTTALKYALDIGQGTGPVGHFFPLLEGQAHS